MKRVIRRVVAKARNYLREEEREEGPPDFSKHDFAYPWLNYVFQNTMKEGGPGMYPSYTLGVTHGAYLAKALGIPRISVLEFGVAGGNGLVALEKAAEIVERVLGVKIDVYGFDTGVGLPKPTDYRDLPNIYTQSGFAMDVEKLKKRLKRAQLFLGLVERTLPDFVKSRPAPVAFMSVDVDYYSSSVHVLKLLEADASILLPRIHLYFDDIMGFTCSEFNGERLAIAEFNDAHSMRKISPIYGLKHFLPPHHATAQWAEMIYLAHIFDHKQYGEPDGLVRRAHDVHTRLREGEA